MPSILDKKELYPLLCWPVEMVPKDVNDRSVMVQGAGQRVLANIVSGFLSYHVHIHSPYTDHEWDTLPQVVWMADTDWDPSVLNHTAS